MKKFLFAIVVISWFALIGQFWLHMQNDSLPASELLVRYFSYFTILTNLMIAMAATALLFAANSVLARFINKPAAQTAIAVYITIVGITYNLLLRSVWQPQGLQRVVDEMLHVVVPVLWVLYWFVAVPKQQLKWSNTWAWLLYPLIYTILIFIRGAVSGFYPYFFIDAAALGMPRALLNAVFVAMAFGVVSLLFIGIGKLRVVSG